MAVEQAPWVTRVLNHFVSFFLLGGTVTFGLRPPWEIRWLGLPLAPFALMIWAGTFLYTFSRMRNARQRTGGWLFLGMTFTLAAGFVFTSFGVDPSGRYFLPFVVPLSLAAAFTIHRMISKPVWRASAIVVLLIYQAWGTLDCALRNPPGITTQFDNIAQIDTHYQQQLIDFLAAQGETTGYSNYWVSYPTAFLSSETIIFVPRLPYHQDLRYTARDDRYPPYEERVNASHHIAYITTHNPALDEVIINGLKQLNVTWQEKQIGDYHVYFHLSRVVHPQELGIGGAP